VSAKGIETVTIGIVTGTLHLQRLVSVPFGKDAKESWNGIENGIDVYGSAIKVQDVFGECAKFHVLHADHSLLATFSLSLWFSFYLDFLSCCSYLIIQF